MFDVYHAIIRLFAERVLTKLCLRFLHSPAAWKGGKIFGEFCCSWQLNSHHQMSTFSVSIQKLLAALYSGSITLTVWQCKLNRFDCERWYLAQGVVAHAAFTTRLLCASHGSTIHQLFLCGIQRFLDYPVVREIFSETWVGTPKTGCLNFYI